MQICDDDAMRGTILIVEDEPDLVDTLEYNLKQEGYDTQRALRGKKKEPSQAPPHPLSGGKTPLGLGLLVLAVGGVTAAVVEHSLNDMSEVEVGAALGRFGAVLPFICALCVVLVLGSVVLGFYLLAREARWRSEAAAPKTQPSDSGRERLLALIEGMSQALLALDSGMRVGLANVAARALLGANVDPLGRTLPELLRGPAVDRILHALSNGRPAEAELEINADKRRTVLVRAAPLDHGGAVLVLVEVEPTPPSPPPGGSALPDAPVL